MIPTIDRARTALNGLPKRSANCELMATELGILDENPFPKTSFVFLQDAFTIFPSRRDLQSHAHVSHAGMRISIVEIVICSGHSCSLLRQTFHISGTFGHRTADLADDLTLRGTGSGK